MIKESASISSNNQKGYTSGSFIRGKGEANESLAKKGVGILSQAIFFWEKGTAKSNYQGLNTSDPILGLWFSH